MVTEKEFFEKYKDYSKEQLLMLAYVNQLKADQMEENYKGLARRFYGPRTEKINPGQLDLFNEAELVVETAEPAEVEESETLVTESKKQSNKGKRNARLKDVQVKEEHIWPESRICPECGKPMQELKTDTVEYLEYIPQKYILHRYVIHNLTCRSCNDQNMDMAVYNGRNTLPPRLISGSFATESLVTHFAGDKLLLGVPFYRQEKDLARQGIGISRQNMCGWVVKTADMYLRFLYERMLKDVRCCEIVNMDETTLNCLEEKKSGRESASYAWLIMSGEHEPKQIALYVYNASREYSTVDKILGSEYNGVIQSDGYGAYTEYTGTDKKAGCWAHCRRYFYDALTGNEKLYKAYQKANRTEKQKILDDYPSLKDILKMMEYIQRMFRFEEKYKADKLGPEEILEQRKKNNTEILEEIKELAAEMEKKYLPSGKAGKAVTYLLNQWEPLNYFMKDGRVPMSNNIAEREGIKPLVQSRKNFLFADTVRGAEATMVWFSLFISAVMNHLDPRAYVEYVLKQMCSNRITGELIDQLVPYSKSLPDQLVLKRR
jgi:transposase